MNTPLYMVQAITLSNNQNQKEKIKKKKQIEGKDIREKIDMKKLSNAPSQT